MKVNKPVETLGYLFRGLQPLLAYALWPVYEYTSVSPAVVPSQTLLREGKANEVAITSQMEEDEVKHHCGFLICISWTSQKTKQLCGHFRTCF